ncbi:MAG: tetratricopeptide repeat protein [Candidatus Eisenbacteria bacterium]|nr:tetratricopeptide repeat protein [Candidatus Eisenbacteria bacterium]
MRLTWRWGTRPSGLVPVFLILLCLAAGVGIPESLAAETEPPPVRILLITLDGARADILSHPESCPNLSSLARTGIVLDGATAPSPQSFPAIASAMTGLYPGGSGVIDDYSAPLSQGVETLAEILRAMGWRTVAFPADYLCHSRSGIGQGFDDFRQLSPGFSDGARVDSVLAALGAQEQGRSFLWVAFTTAIEHPSWDRHLGSGSADSTAYLEKITKLDAEIGRLRAGLGRLGLEDGTLIVSMGTTGEAVPGWTGSGEDPERPALTGHGLTLSEESIRVPWIFNWPGRALGPSDRPAVSSWVSTIDLLPTLVEIAKGSAPKGLDGISLVPALRGGRLPDRVLFHEAHPGRTTGWGPRVAARGSSLALLSYGGRSALREIRRGATRERRDDEARLLLEALRRRYPHALPPSGSPVDRDSLFAAENREIRGLLDARGVAADGEGARSEASVVSLARAFPENGLLQIERALFALYSQREKPAAFLLDSLLAARPDFYEAQALFVEHMIFFRRYDAAIEHLQKASASPMFESDRLWRLGAIQIAAKKYNEAAQTYALARSVGASPGTRWRLFEQYASTLHRHEVEIESHPENTAAKVEQGKILAELGLFRDAYMHFNQARMTREGDPEPEYWLGHTLMIEGRATHAIIAYQRALELDPGRVDARVELAYAQIQIGQRDAALQNLETAVSSGTTDAWAHYNLACLLASKGDGQKALGEIDVALRKGFTRRDLLETDPDLESIRAEPRFLEILSTLR